MIEFKALLPSLSHVIRTISEFLQELHAVKVDLYLHQQALDTTTPAGRAMFQMMGVFAEFERAMIQERIKAGLARARAQGRRLGREPGPSRKRQKVAREVLKPRPIRRTSLTGCSTTERPLIAVELGPSGHV